MKEPINLEDGAPADLPQELKDHLPIAEAASLANLETAKELHAIELHDLQGLLRATSQARIGKDTKLGRLRFLAGNFSQVFSVHTACSSGCTHCCHIGATVPRSEAQLIAKRTGAKLREPTHVHDILTPPVANAYTGTACTFLKAGRCSIYAQRPMVCRTLINMDSVDVLCRLVPGMQVPVPYLNTQDIQAFFGSLVFKDDCADVREWFPEGAP